MASSDMSLLYLSVLRVDAERPLSLSALTKVLGTLTLSKIVWRIWCSEWPSYCVFLASLVKWKFGGDD